MAASKRLALLIWLALFLATASELQAQVLDLTIHQVGLSIGDAQRVIGVRCVAWPSEAWAPGFRSCAGCCFQERWRALQT